MGSFKRVLLGFRRSEVEAAIAARDGQIRALEPRAAESERQAEAIAAMERELASLSGMVIEREREIRGLSERLREAVEVSRRVQELTEAQVPPAPTASGPAANGNGRVEDFDGIFEGLVQLEIGPLGDFAQLVGFEDAVGQVGASDISVERFSEGRATLSVRLDQPVELLRELEELSSLDFKVRHTGPDNLILDVDEESGEQRAA